MTIVWRVFLSYEAPDYSEEGINEFRKSIYDPQYLSMLYWYGAFDKDNIVGVIATRDSGNHIALFFVDGKYHKKGIGRKLFELIINSNLNKKITVNSSHFAIPIYQHLGFIDTDIEQITNGLRYTPMEYTK